VSATLRPTPDSEIQTEIWLPTRWNGKFLAVGSGGWGGSIAYDGMAEALRRGYATSATDDGHAGSSASFLFGHPDKFKDFAYRAEHEMTSEAKFFIHAYYGKSPEHSYWNGCSGGGREGLLQAARYPDEFDGIIAGDPANMGRNAWALWLANQTFKDPANRIPPEKYPMIHKAVLAACDQNDGVKDGLIEDPTTCHPDFKALACKSGNQLNCLTARQVETARITLSPATTASGKILFPALEPGSELGWVRLTGGPQPADLFVNQFRYVYQNPDWDWRTFDLERDSQKANAANHGIVEVDPDLTGYAEHGGKLLLYHGWADQQVAPGSTVDFYNATVALSPNQRAVWVRLFMVPGMAHCSGGEGPDTFDKISALEQWVEQSKVPASIVATHFNGDKPDRTRPLCPYPQTAHYLGQGSIDEAVNFACSAPQ